MITGRISQADIFEYSKGYLYRYTDDVYKLTVCSRVRKAGYELADGCKSFTRKGEAGNVEKLPQNVRRAKSKVFELAICNSFDFFCTLTFSPEKVRNRADLNGCMKSFGIWLKHYNSRHPGANVRYLLIPELHQKGGWHLHGLISGIPEDSLRAFRPDEHLPYHILNELKKGHTIYQWTNYDMKFGYCTLSPVRSVERVSKYITKYITKELDESIKSLNAHMYYRSKGLKQKELLYSAADCVLPDPDYDGNYCKIKNGTSAEELAAYFTLESEVNPCDPEPMVSHMAASVQAWNDERAVFSSIGDTAYPFPGGASFYGTS